MRIRSVVRIGTTILVLIYSASSVEVAVGRRRRNTIWHGSGPAEPRIKHSDGLYEHEIHRYLGVGLDDLKYGNTGVQHYTKEDKGGKSEKAKGKGKGYYYADDYRGKGKGYAPSNGKGKGKGYNSFDSIDSEDLTISSKSSKSLNEKKEHLYSKKEKQTKLQKSDKASPTHKPISKPTRIPMNDKPTPSPSNASTDNDITGLLTPYTIRYTVTNEERPPFRSELLDVVELTRVYLDNYFSAYYRNSERTNLETVMTLFTNIGFEFGEPIRIDYDSKVVIDASSVSVPNKEDLDSILLSAFEGEYLDGYIGLVQALPSSNMFSSTQYVKIGQMIEESPSLRFGDTSTTSIAKNMTLGAIVVGGAVGLILIFASTRLYRRQTHREIDGSVFGNKSSATIATHGSRQDDRMLRPICDELYNDAIENRR